MKYAYAAIAAVAIMAAAFCLVPMAESDAAEASCSIGPAQAGSFDTMSGGKITIAINHNSFEFDLKITVTESGSSYKHVEEQTIAKGQKEIVIKMSDMDSSGSHTIKIVLEPAPGSGAFPGTSRPCPSRSAATPCPTGPPTRSSSSPWP